MSDEKQDIVERVRTSTALMANLCSVRMDLWQEHSTAALDAANEIGRLRSVNAALVEALATMKAWAMKGHAHWDAAEDMKAGKILLALAGELPCYSADIDRAHAAAFTAARTGED